MSSTVGEYVIVDPLEQYATRFTLDGASYDSGTTVGGNEVLDFASLAGVSITMWEIFELPPPGSLPAGQGQGT